MKIYIAGIESHKDVIMRQKPPNVLFSYAICKGVMPEYVQTEHCKSYLLDSGAFSFMNGAKRVDFDSYTDRYIDFINDNKVPLFFEMDLDVVVGLPKVEEYRRRIERRTGKQCIPVFHRERGKDYFIDMVKNYKYVALGGIAVNEIKKKRAGLYTLVYRQGARTRLQDTRFRIYRFQRDRELSV